MKVSQPTWQHQEWSEPWWLHPGVHAAQPVDDREDYLNISSKLFTHRKTEGMSATEGKEMNYVTVFKNREHWC